MAAPHVSGIAALLYSYYGTDTSPDTIIQILKESVDKSNYLDGLVASGGRVNAYNAFTMKSVIEHWPTKSVRDIGFLPYSFFWRQKFVAGGKQYTLNNIENDFLRKQLQEPRIHFVIVCASNSCPRLQREAFTEENTERLLEAAARFFINEPRNLQIDRESNRVTVARIFTFFEEDFENYARKAGKSTVGHPLLDYIWIYANEDHRTALRSLHNPTVRDFEYDWGINDVNAPASTGR